MEAIKNHYRVLGLMSGTSLDGLDLADCIFELQNGKWRFEIINSNHVAYSNFILDKLKTSTQLSSSEIDSLDKKLGQIYGDECLKFDLNKIDFIASHGHTIFHKPKESYTLQIGNLNLIHSITKKTVIGDFRSLDVSLGGQGAPLVPIGDRLLFDNYLACVNLGGFANISMEKSGDRIAWDLCPVNVVLNHFALKLGHEFDPQGMFAREGEVNEYLLNQMNNLEYYSLRHPKSLGLEWVLKHIFPLFDPLNISPQSALATCVEHISSIISKEMPEGKVLFSGGGVFNEYLMERIKNQTQAEIHLPSKEIIDFKEAMIFAFLGVLRIRNEINTLSSVTGASRDSSGGVIVS